MDPLKGATFAFLYLVACLFLGTPGSGITALPTEQSLSSFQRTITEIARQSTQKWRSLAPTLIASLASNTSSSPCTTTLVQSLSTLYSQEWSAKFFTLNHLSGDTFFANLIRSQYTSLGDFEECLSIDHRPDSQLDVPFGGKYCLALVNTPQVPYFTEVQLPQEGIDSPYLSHLATRWLNIRNRFPLALGVCLPSVCTTEVEMKMAVDLYFQNTLSNFNLTVDYCQEKSGPLGRRSPPGYFIAIGIICLFTLASLSGTLIYAFFAQKGIPCGSLSVVALARCFHLGHNVKSVFKVRSSSKGDTPTIDLRFLHGIKFVQTVNVVFMHAFIYFPAANLTNLSLYGNYPSFYLQTQSSPLYTLLLKGPIVLNMFVIISAFLATHSLLHLKPNRLPAFPLYAFLRWIRFFPSLLAHFSLSILAQTVGSGPLFHPKLTDAFVRQCTDNWWLQGLMLHNYLPLNQMCGLSTWFIAMDFQLFLALYLFLWLHFYRKSLAKVVPFMVACAVTVLYFSLVAFRLIIVPTLDYPMYLHIPLPYSHIRLYYTSPLIYLVPYLGGMYMAMRLANRTSAPTSVKPSSPFHPDLKLLTLLLLLIGTVLLPLPGTDEKESSPLEKSAQYDSYIRVANLVIALFGGLFLYQLALASSGKSWFKRASSASFLIPLSRLSLGMYLLNPLLIWFNASMNHLTPRLSIFANVRMD